ncbi:MAG: M81 family metallopeptidase [Pikeienuella sp.]
MPRIAIGGFQNETNTFSPVAGSYELFLRADGWPGLTRGPAVFDALAGFNISMAGLLAGARQAGSEIVPLAWAGGGASGIVTADAFERIAAMLLEDLAAALPVDGVLFDLHGAMVAEHLEDGDGEMLRRLRALVGPEVPIFCALDLHANISPQMVAHADRLTLCRTYPHLDMAQTGRRVAQALADHLAGARAPVRILRQIPFLIPTPRGCTLSDPAKTVYARLAELECRPGVTELSVACGFSDQDVPHAGPAVLGYGTDAAAVEAAVAALEAEILRREAAFAHSPWRPDAAVAHARAAAAGPVILADTEDNAGGGEPSDTTWLLAALLDQGAEAAVLGLLADPEAAAAAHRAGLGAEITVAVGAKSEAPGHRPVTKAWRVAALSDGRFRATGPYFAGARLDLGPMAVLAREGVQVVVSTAREQAADQAMFTHLGIDPKAARVLVLKSAVHYRADFQPIAAEILEVAAPDRQQNPQMPQAYRNLRPGLRMAPCGQAFPPPH